MFEDIRKELGDTIVGMGHEEPCGLCGAELDIFAGNPGLWPVGVCTSFAPGSLKYYCQRCIGNLVENALIEKELDKYNKS